MICPKCGQTVKQDAVICPHCNFIMDTSFLGNDILDEEKDLRPGPGGVSPALFNLRDAVVLSDIDDSSGVPSESLEIEDNPDKPPAERLYVSGRSQAFIAPDAIPAIMKHVDGKSLTPFEQHVLEYVDGRRPVERIQRHAGLNDVEVKTALANLADRGVVKIIGRAFADDLPLDDSFEISPEDNIFSVATQSIMRRTSSAGGPGIEDLGQQVNPEIEDLFKTQSIISPLNTQERNALRGHLSDPDEGGVFSDEEAERPTGVTPSDIDFAKENGTAELKGFRSAFNRPPLRPKTGVNKAEALIYDEARHLEKEGRISEAIDRLNAGIALNNQVPAFYNQLGVIYALHRKDYARAADFIKQALALDPRNNNYKSNLAKILPKLSGSN